MRTNYKWYNLNPYYVLQLDIDATEEDIKYRYRKLSSKVHPDKLLGVEPAREAFEQVKAAYLRLIDPEQRATIIKNIEFVSNDIRKDRRKQLAKAGGGVDESSLPPLEMAVEKAVMKLFADIEQQKRRSET
jgi:DnaJ family protein C protein 8